MKAIIICGQSALELYKLSRISNRRLEIDNKIKGIIKDNSSFQNQIDLEAYDLPKSKDIVLAIQSYIEDLIMPFDIMLMQKLRSHNTKFVKYHWYNGNFPISSIYHLKDEIFIVRPELMFCQLSTLFSMRELIDIAMELCGTYTITNDTVFYSIPNVTTKEELYKYLIRLKYSYPNWKGIRNIESAIRIIANNSASPKESELYINLCLPRKFGGYGIGWKRGALKGGLKGTKKSVDFRSPCSSTLQLNKRIKLSYGASKICGANYIRPDIIIPESKIAIEYDSDSFHDNSKQNIRDKRRIDALIHDGWKVYCIVPGQMSNSLVFNNSASQIKKQSKLK